MASEIQALATFQGERAVPAGQASRGREGGAQGKFGMLMGLALATLTGRQLTAIVYPGASLAVDVVQAGQETDGAGPVEAQVTPEEGGAETGGNVQGQSTKPSRPVARQEAAPVEPAGSPAGVYPAVEQSLAACALVAAQVGQASPAAAATGGEVATDWTRTAHGGGVSLVAADGFGTGSEWVSEETAPVAGLTVTGLTVPDAAETSAAQGGAARPVTGTAAQGTGVRQSDDLAVLINVVPEPQTAPAFAAGQRQGTGPKDAPAAAASWTPALETVVAEGETVVAEGETVVAEGETKAAAARPAGATGQGVAPEQVRGTRTNAGGRPAQDAVAASGSAAGYRKAAQGVDSARPGSSGERQEGAGEGDKESAPAPSSKEPFRGVEAQDDSGAAREATATIPVAKSEKAEAVRDVQVQPEQAREGRIAIRDALSLSETLLLESLKRLPRNVELRMDPPEMGKVTVLLSQRGQDVTVKFLAGTGEAQRMLEGASEDLGRALSEKGLVLVGFAVDPHSRDKAGSQNQGDAAKTGNRRYARSAAIQPAKAPAGAGLSTGGFDRLA